MYRLDGGDSFPDPASRYQPDGVHKASQIIDPKVFEWTDQDWHGIELEDLVIYELHVGTATKEGTFDALITRLGSIRELGVTAIQLMPVADFPGERNWGYDGVSLFAPARAYGGPEALRRLVDAAHARHLAVILDVVFNHLGPEGNYLEKYSKSYFTDQHTTDWGKALNYVGKSGRPVRDFFVANACYWADEYHIDGLHLDAIQAIKDTEDPHIIAELAIRVRESLSGKRSFLIIAEDEYNDPELVQPMKKGGFGLDAVYADDFHHQMHVALTGEKTGYYMDYSGTIEDLVTTLQQGWWFTGQVSQWRSIKQGKTVKVGQKADTVSPPHFIYCTENHDHVGNRPFGERLNHLVKPEAYRAVSTLLLLSPYTPLLFMGQEWAASTPFQFFTDFHYEEAIQGVIEGRPKDMEALFPGYGQQTPDSQDYKMFQRSKLHWWERNRAPHSGILQLYRHLLKLRRELPAMCERARGAFQVAAVGEHALALRREAPEHAKHTVLLIVNLGGTLQYDLGERDETKPSAGYVWSQQPLLDTENPQYGGCGDTPFADGAKLQMSGPQAILLRVEQSS
jgi:maltooligosyltrehalose trehalohydrolase